MATENFTTKPSALDSCWGTEMLDALARTVMLRCVGCGGCRRVSGP
ncbi:hypothetical protein CKAH01_16898 [Colletotrichum kahawae]|uniref:Uncharacterized protein n=1 Tax=Colletotrichum kahawae TaxID=34407 RepID=A0AAE0D4T3_COLKA|nr:hypothetical protein CKAH01_16898 [Colletotrichum kahawae]